MTLLSRDTILLGLACTADLIITAILISTGFFTEANPLLAHYLQYGLGAMCLAKLVSYVVPLAIAEWYRRQQPVFVGHVLRATLYLYVGGYLAGITAVNLPILLS